MPDFIKQPWPWYIGGPLIGLMVPLLLLMGNKTFGVSSSLRHLCAACLPVRPEYFRYNWRKEAWNLFFAFGIVAGAFLAAHFMMDGQPMNISPKLAATLGARGVTDLRGMMPAQLFSWSQLFTLRGFILIVVGGFLVGFGTRYAGGCTSGHSIMGLSNLQLPSLVATVCFMAGGFLMANLILPAILKL